MSVASEERVLIVSPHPDDESIGCGGTIAKLVAAGAAARVVFLTSGEGGGHGMDPDETRVLREKEASAAAAVLGIASIDFWHQPDGYLRARRPLVERLRAELCSWSPTTVYAPHAGEMHPDHRATARIVAMACQGLSIETLYFEVWTPLARFDEIVDVTSTIGTKVEAIRSYASQCNIMRFDDAFTGLARYRGEMFSWPQGDYAEVFLRGRV